MIETLRVRGNGDYRLEDRLIECGTTTLLFGSGSTGKSRTLEALLSLAAAVAGHNGGEPPTAEQMVGQTAESGFGNIEATGTSPDGRAWTAAARPVAGQAGAKPDAIVETTGPAREALSGVRMVAPDARAIRLGADADPENRERLRGDCGNLASVAVRLLAHPTDGDLWISWLKALSNDRISGAQTTRDEKGLTRVLFKENNRLVPLAAMGSRFLHAAAIAAAFFDKRPGQGESLVIDDACDAADHHSLTTLAEILATRTGAPNVQVIAACRSPRLVAWMDGWIDDVDKLRIHVCHRSGDKLAVTPLESVKNAYKSRPEQQALDENQPAPVEASLETLARNGTLEEIAEDTGRVTTKSYGG